MTSLTQGATNRQSTTPAEEQRRAARAEALFEMLLELIDYDPARIVSLLQSIDEADEITARMVEVHVARSVEHGVPLS